MTTSKFKDVFAPHSLTRVSKTFPLIYFHRKKLAKNGKIIVKFIQKENQRKSRLTSTSTHQKIALRFNFQLYKEGTTQWSSATPFRRKNSVCEEKLYKKWNAATLDRMMIYSICKVICMCQRCFFFPPRRRQPHFFHTEFSIVDYCSLPKILLWWIRLTLHTHKTQAHLLQKNILNSRFSKMRMGRSRERKTFSFLCNYENSNWEKYTKEKFSQVDSFFVWWCRASKINFFNWKNFSKNIIILWKVLCVFSLWKKGKRKSKQIVKRTKARAGTINFAQPELSVREKSEREAKKRKNNLLIIFFPIFVLPFSKLHIASWEKVGKKWIKLNLLNSTNLKLKRQWI